VQLTGKNIRTIAEIYNVFAFFQFLSHVKSPVSNILLGGPTAWIEYGEWIESTKKVRLALNACQVHLLQTWCEEDCPSPWRTCERDNPWACDFRNRGGQGSEAEKFHLLWSQLSRTDVFHTQTHSFSHSHRHPQKHTQTRKQTCPLLILVFLLECNPKSYVCAMTSLKRSLIHTHTPQSSRVSCVHYVSVKRSLSCALVTKNEENSYVTHKNESCYTCDLNSVHGETRNLIGARCPSWIHSCRRLSCTAIRTTGGVLSQDWFMFAFITWNSNLVSLLEGLCTSNPCRFGFSGVWVFARVAIEQEFSYLCWNTCGCNHLSKTHIQREDGITDRMVKAATPPCGIRRSWLWNEVVNSRSKHDMKAESSTIQPVQTK